MLPDRFSLFVPEVPYATWADFDEELLSLELQELH